MHVSWQFITAKRPSCEMPRIRKLVLVVLYGVSRKRHVTSSVVAAGAVVVSCREFSRSSGPRGCCAFVSAHSPPCLRALCQGVMCGGALAVGLFGRVVQQCV